MKEQELLDFAVFEAKMRKPWHLTTEDFADYIGISRHAIGFYRRNGINFYTADKLCINNGTHPVNIWGYQEYVNPSFHPQPCDRNEQETRKEAS